MTADFDRKIPTPPLDWSTEFTDGQWEDMQRFYGVVYGNGDVSPLETSNRYIPFAHDICPDALKRYRLWSSAVARGVGFGDAPRMWALTGACSLHYYCVDRYPQGIRYSLNNARRRGLKKTEAADIFALAWLHGGPFTMNIAAQMTHEYMLAWDPAQDGPGYPWPDGWDVDPEAFSSAIDFSASSDANEISPQDLERIERWHLRVEGEVPRYVSFLAQNNPLALRVFRARFENCTQRSLPKQYVALAWLHLAILWKRPEAIRRALHMAKVFGVSREQVVHMVSVTHVKVGHIGMDAGLEGLEGTLDHW